MNGSRRPLSDWSFRRVIPLIVTVFVVACATVVWALWPAPGPEPFTVIAAFFATDEISDGNRTEVVPTLTVGVHNGTIGGCVASSLVVQFLDDSSRPVYSTHLMSIGDDGYLDWIEPHQSRVYKIVFDTKTLPPTWPGERPRTLEGKLIPGLSVRIDKSLIRVVRDQ